MICLNFDFCHFWKAKIAIFNYFLRLRIRARLRFDLLVHFIKVNCKVLEIKSSKVHTKIHHHDFLESCRFEVSSSYHSTNFRFYVKSIYGEKHSRKTINYSHRKIFCQISVDLWKFQNSSTIQILREIKVGEFRVSNLNIYHFDTFKGS